MDWMRAVWRGMATGWWAPVAVMAFWGTVGILALDTAFPKYDLLNDYASARALVADGTIPTGGSVSSFGSVNPPGVGYGFVPGILLGGEDPGQARRLGALFWFGVALAGLWVWTRRRFGAGTAVLATLLFGLGAPGIFYAVTLWPRAHPAFLVWLLFWLDRWCVEREKGALAWVLGIAAAGSYWMLEFLPAWLVIGAAVVIYRPPLDWKRGLVPGILVAILVWGPYLWWQAERDFRDLRSLLLLQDLHPELKTEPLEELGLAGDWKLLKERPDRWDRYFRGGQTDGSVETPRKGHWEEDERFGKLWVLHNRTRVDGQMGNFFKPREEPRWYFQAERSLRIWQKESGWEEEPHPVRLVDGWVPESRPRFRETDRAAVVLLNNYNLLLLEGLWGLWIWLLVLYLLTTTARLWEARGNPRWMAVAVWAAAGMLWLVSAAVVASGIRLSLPSHALLWGLLVIIPLGASALTSLGRSGRREEPAGGAGGAVLGLVALLLMIPWLVNSVTVLGDGWSRIGRRYLWLYLLQAILVAVMWRHLAVYWIRRRWWFGIGVCVLVLVTAFNGRTVFELERSLDPGGRKGGVTEAAICAWIADYARENLGESELRIGYDIPFEQFNLHWHAVDARYKVGRDYDALLRDRFGIRNLCEEPTGLSQTSEVILVDKVPGGNPALRFWDLRDFKRQRIVYEDARWVVLVP